MVEDDGKLAQFARGLILSPRDARDLHRILRSLVSKADSESSIVPLEVSNATSSLQGQPPRPAFDQSRTGMHPLSKPELLDRANSILRMRQRRRKHFPAEMFSEPAWDILLTLYLAAGAGRKLSIAQVAILARTSGSTGLRWTTFLDQAGLISRRPNPSDQRTVSVQLTDQGTAALEAFLEEMGNEAT